MCGTAPGFVPAFTSIGSKLVHNQIIRIREMVNSKEGALKSWPGDPRKERAGSRIPRKNGIIQGDHLPRIAGNQTPVVLP